jgi:hypothetical protein
MFFLFLLLSLKPPRYTLAGFDLTTHGSNPLDDSQRRYHYLDRATWAFHDYVPKYISVTVAQISIVLEQEHTFI